MNAHRTDKKPHAHKTENKTAAEHRAHREAKAAAEHKAIHGETHTPTAHEHAAAPKQDAHTASAPAHAHVKGTQSSTLNAPGAASISSDEIMFPDYLMQAVEEMGFDSWTEIQLKTIPIIQQGIDLIGQSHTGSGKTAAFGLPILERIHQGRGIQALILVPTRELCEQVCQEMKKFSKFQRRNTVAVYGGVGINPQIHDLRSADIVVGTPGRILDHLNRGTFNTKAIHTLVLDEADKMFEMGFIEDVKRIISTIPKERQTLLFSATMPPQVQAIVRNYMKSPQVVKVQSYVDHSKLTQVFYDVAYDHQKKFPLLLHVLNTEKSALTLVFCSTRRSVDSVVHNLKAHGIPCEAIHGGLSQNQRKRTLDMFHRQEINVLVASDVAARGLDIKNVSHVINYELPRTSSEYIHRIGRTARAGSEGKVISILSKEDYGNFKDIRRDPSIILQELPLPVLPEVKFERLGRGHRPMRPGGGFSGRPSYGAPPRGRDGGMGFRGRESRGGFNRSRREGGFGGPRREGGFSRPREGSGMGEGFNSRPRYGNDSFQGGPSMGGTMHRERRTPQSGFARSAPRGDFTSNTRGNDRGFQRGPTRGSPAGEKKFTPRKRNPDDITDHPIRKKFGDKKF